MHRMLRNSRRAVKRLFTVTNELLTISGATQMTITIYYRSIKPCVKVQRR